MAQYDPYAPQADIVHSAHRLIREHGPDAVMVAELRAERQLGQGDMDGYRTWKRIELVVDGLAGLIDSNSAPAH